MVTIDPMSLGAVAAAISAMVDVLRIGKETYQEYFNRRKNDPDLPNKERALQQAFSTYSSDEIDAIKKRIENCRKRFIEEGAGPERRNCICSVLTDVRDGNGGIIPDQEWEDAFNQLNCAT